MALSEREKLLVVKILGVAYNTLSDRLAMYNEFITTEVASQVLDEIDRWEAVGNEFIEIFPTESNKGVRIEADRAKNDIRRNLANLLYVSDLVNVGGYNTRIGTVQIQSG